MMLEFLLYAVLCLMGLDAIVSIALSFKRLRALRHHDHLIPSTPRSPRG